MVEKTSVNIRLKKKKRPNKHSIKFFTKSLIKNYSEALNSEVTIPKDYSWIYSLLQVTFSYIISL